MPLPQSPQTARTPGGSKSDSLTAELRGVFGRYMAPDNTEYEDAHNVVQIFMLSIMCLCLTYHIAARTVTTILDTFVWAVTRAAAGVWTALVAVAMVPGLWVCADDGAAGACNNNNDNRPPGLGDEDRDGDAGGEIGGAGAQRYRGAGAEV
ncbi:hypothetical protein UCDDS831_g05789 [Diplodia seriata]|uniref:Uncharacterized protein n=1 Tax=Diplodia seriata TaxID=420778 RepID=A0A0G2E8T1_9PEZI|nr:hypothetical protein UCDDS831_g05789 [Diplodia seriata]